MEIDLGAAKARKYATSESGDTLEFIERPGGGLSIVLADGQRSGKSAKNIANKVASKVISLLSDGVRDGAAARAASDYLYHERRGKVMATLNILSVDLLSKTLVITRNNPAPVFIVRGGEIRTHDEPCQPVGTRRDIRPVIHEVPLEVGVTVVVFTDGITNAGVRTGEKLDMHPLLEEMLAGEVPAAQAIADRFMAAAMRLDQGRPSDDISIVVLHVREHTGDDVRRVSVQIPFGPV